MLYMNLEVLKHQYEFITDIEHRYLGLVGGYGCGKTHALCIKAMHLASMNPNHYAALLEPTYGMVKKNLIPTLDDILSKSGIPHTARRSNDPEYKLFFKRGPCTIYLASAENYDRLAGLNLAFFGVDETDRMKTDTAYSMWRLMQSRLRKGVVFQGFTTSTPEGFKFLHDYFVLNKADNKRIIHARTQDNPMLPPEFIPDLIESYPPELINAYLEGQFCNLTSGTVYDTFSREHSHTNMSLDDKELNNRVLHVGMDFNVGKCCAIIHIVKDGIPYALDEIHGAKNTQAMIESLRHKYNGRKIVVYPDSSGKNQGTNASTTSLQLLSGAGFDLDYPNKNPFVRDRIQSMNAMFLNGNKKRRYFVNTDKCQVYTAALEQQSYDKNGQPDKQHDQDHPNDAAGYFIHRKFPIKRRGTVRSF